MSTTQDPNSQVTADHDAINALGQLLLDSLTGADVTNGGVSAGQVLFVNAPKSVAAANNASPPGLGMTAEQYAELGDGKVADYGIGLLPGYCADGSYFINAYNAKKAFNTQIAAILSLLGASPVNGAPSIYGMVKDLGDGLQRAAAMYAQGEQVAYTDMSSLESELGVTAPTPQLPGV